jgi:hypothetical protein
MRITGNDLVRAFLGKHASELIRMKCRIRLEGPGSIGERTGTLEPSSVGRELRLFTDFGVTVIHSTADITSLELLEDSK